MWAEVMSCLAKSLRQLPSNELILMRLLLVRHKRLGLISRVSVSSFRSKLNSANVINLYRKENNNVTDAKFDEKEGLWTVFIEDGTTYKARTLVCADGAPSKLGKSCFI